MNLILRTVLTSPIVLQGTFSIHRSKQTIKDCGVSIQLNYKKKGGGHQSWCKDIRLDQDFKLNWFQFGMICFLLIHLYSQDGEIVWLRFILSWGASATNPSRQFKSSRVIRALSLSGFPKHAYFQEIYSCQLWKILGRIIFFLPLILDCLQNVLIYFYPIVLQLYCIVHSYTLHSIVYYMYYIPRMATNQEDGGLRWFVVCQIPQTMKHHKHLSLPNQFMVQMGFWVQDASGMESNAFHSSHGSCSSLPSELRRYLK